MNKNSWILLVLLLIFSGGATNAREFHDIRFADTVTIPGTQQDLQLNGIGYRSKFLSRFILARCTPWPW